MFRTAPAAAFLALGLAALAQPAAAQALCIYVEEPGRPRPQVFWPEPPADLAAGELVLEVVFENWAGEPSPVPPLDAAEVERFAERVVTGASCTRYATYRVVRVVAGAFAGDRLRAQVSVADAVWTPDGPRLLVGRMVPYVSYFFPGHTFDPREVFAPRHPPQ